MSGPATGADGVDAADTLKILLATDNHVGYMDGDATRGNDSINTFEEILQIAQREEVDMVLLGGDLFHDNKPSRRSLLGCMELLRRYCHGDRPCAVELLSDPSTNFGHTRFPVSNYEDPNLNIAIPVFSIHGNHDDPAGNGNYCTLDLLHAAGLVNYFGKVTSLDKIRVSPLLLRKGRTRLALYGLGAVRDERLHRLFCNKHVSMLRPSEHADDWFNVLVLHQNRAKHGATNYIPEQFLDDFLDLVFWGHEHECRVEPALNAAQNFYVTQPGSSIATSLSEGETKEKGVGLLLINGKNFKIRKLALETVRQFYMEDVVLSETHIAPGEPDTLKRVEAYCSEKMEELLDRAARERVGRSKVPDKPLIRLRVDYTNDYEIFSSNRFGQKYVDRVANPKDIVQFHRQKAHAADRKTKDDGMAVSMDVTGEALDSTRVEDMVREFFLKADKTKQLSLLTERGMSDAVKEFVDKEEREAIAELVKYQLQKTQDYLRRRKTSEAELDTEVQRFKEERRKNAAQEESDVREAISRARSVRGGATDAMRGEGASDAAASDEDEEALDTASAAGAAVGARGRGRGGRGARGGAPRGRGSRGGGRGRGVVAGETLSKRGNQSIKDAFHSSSRNSRAANAKSSDEDCSIVDGGNATSDDEPSGPSTSKRGKQPLQLKVPPARGRGGASQGGTGRKGGRGGVSYSDDDEEFDRLVPLRQKRK